MAESEGRQLAAALAADRDALLDEWVADQLSSGATGTRSVGLDEVRRESGEFLRTLEEALAAGADGSGLDGAGWSDLRAWLEQLSASRARQGARPSETATFVFSLREPLFKRLEDAYEDDPAGLRSAIRWVSDLVDRLGLLTFEAFQRTREELIRRHQQELLELSTPVVELWDGVLALPVIGTLDSERTQIVMETLLERIVETGAAIAILDITGVPTVDTLVAQHLLKTVAAARLMGADCIVSGIRPQIAQTIVHLGITLSDVTTKATLSDALALALERLGLSVSPRPKAGGGG